MSDLALYLPAFLTAYAILLMGTLSPGPAVGMLMGLALERGRATALFATFGIALGSACLNMATLAGFGLLVSQVAWAMTALKFAGALYLAWLAYGAFRKALNPPRIDPAAVPPLAPARAFTMGVAMQITNPKAMAFWIAIHAIGPTTGANLWIIAVFVAGAALLSFLGHAFWAVTLSVPRIRAAYHRGRRRIEAVLGCVFLFASFKLATAKV